MLITINNRYCWLNPVAGKDLGKLDALIKEIEAQWASSEFDTRLMLEAPCIQLVKCILQLLPSEPGLEISLEGLKSDLVKFEELFFRSGSGQSLIFDLHKFDPKLKKAELRKGEPVTAEHLPFPTCGDNANDQLASLLHTFEATTALWAWQNLSLEQIDKILFVLKELSVPENDRIAAYVAKIALKQNSDLFSIEATEKTFNEMKAVVNTGIVPEGWTKA